MFYASRSWRFALGSTLAALCFLSSVAAPAATNAPAADAKGTNAPAAASTNAPEEKPTAPTLPGMAPSKNLFPAAYSGEQTQPLGNYWDGVDDAGDLRVLTGSSWVLDDVGAMVDTAFPCSPNMADLNNDELPDLIVGDSAGFVWIYMNSGKKGEPKFTSGTFLHTFTGWTSRIHVADWDQDGDYDIIIGSFYGDVAILENVGTRQAYTFIRKMGIPRYVSPTHGVEDPKERLPTVQSGKARMLLGIYMVPWVADWNKDMKPDLILGEGTYSANSVRLCVNVGARGKPAFVPERVHYLAFGEGFEQLSPAVVDFNGDGVDDLLVGTRTGQIRMHKGGKKPVDDPNVAAALAGKVGPAILEFDGFLKIAGKEVFSPMSLVYPCDWNQDGLFDLLLGSTSGKIYLSLNKGKSKSEPDFPQAVPIKGVNTDKDLLGPANWGSSIGGVCNAALLLSAEKEVFMKAGAPPIVPVDGNYFMYFRYVKNYLGWMYTGQRPMYIMGARGIGAHHAVLPMKKGKKYEFSFSSILIGKQVTWSMGTTETIKPATDTTPPVHAGRTVSDSIIPSSSWQKRIYTFACPLEVASNGTFSLGFSLPEGDCHLMLDNFSFKELAR